jgi:membrane protein
MWSLTFDLNFSYLLSLTSDFALLPWHVFVRIVKKTMAKISVKNIWKSLKDSFKGFSEDKIPKLSASLAYYTVFSLGPLLIMIIFLCGFFLGREAVQGTIYSQIQGFVGADAAAQIQEIIKNAAISDKGGAAAIIGIITLLIGATTVFGEIQDSINGIWGLKPKKSVGIMGIVKTRILSFGMIATIGFLLLISLAATTVIEVVSDQLQARFSDVTVVVFYIVNLLLTLTVTTILFAFIFKVLPDAKVKWKNIWPGAFATTILFMIGKFLISFYIGKSDVGSTYGAAGSLVVLLIWVYYSAIILYFGAEFTKFYMLNNGVEIQPKKYAELVDTRPPGEPSAVRKEHAQDRPKAPSSSQQKSQQREFIVPAPVQASLETKKDVGLGTVLGGLLIYFFRTGSNKGKE